MWNNKVVIITGSSMGIGKQMASLLLRKGARVIINGRNAEKLDRTLREFSLAGWQAIAIAGDVASAEDCKQIVIKAIQLYGRIDVLINNAGISGRGKIADMQPEVFEQIFCTNILGAFQITREALPWIKQANGSILFISSLAGLHGHGNYAAYCSSKMALTALAQSLRIEMNDTRVHIGIAYPGFVENDFEKMVIDADGHLIPQPARKDIRTISAEKMAQQLIVMIEKRKKRKVFYSLGFVTDIMARYFPFLLEQIAAGIYRKSENAVTKQSKLKVL